MFNTFAFEANFFHVQSAWRHYFHGFDETERRELNFCMFVRRFDADKSVN